MLLTAPQPQWAEVPLKIHISKCVGCHFDYKFGCQKKATEEKYIQVQSQGTCTQKYALSTLISTNHKICILINKTVAIALVLEHGNAIKWKSYMPRKKRANQQPADSELGALLRFTHAWGKRVCMGCSYGRYHYICTQSITLSPVGLLMVKVTNGLHK